MKALIVLVLLLPLVTVSSTSASAPDGSYRVDMKFQSTGALPGEILANDSELASQSHLERILDRVVTVSPTGLGDLGFSKNAYRVFYKAVAIHKLKAVFVI